jgi:hypothetical protein
MFNCHGAAAALGNGMQNAKSDAIAQKIAFGNAIEDEMDTT